MYDQKFVGAAVGAFKENLIARELGIADKSQIKVTGEQPLFGDRLNIINSDDELF